MSRTQEREENLEKKGEKSINDEDGNVCGLTQLIKLKRNEGFREEVVSLEKNVKVWQCREIHKRIFKQ